MLKDFKEQINQLWDKLPRDTLIASLLDPRFKDLDYFPEAEVTVAWDELTAEYQKLKTPANAQNEGKQCFPTIFSPTF